jgi:hypothetical protein
LVVGARVSRSQRALALFRRKSFRPAQGVMNP